MTTPGVIELMTEAADALRREGQSRTADDVLRKRAVQPRRPVVLVAGAPNSGKSSLINALLRRADALPAGADVTTAAPISLFYADPERAAIDRYGERRAMGLDAATALDLATVQGNPLNRHNIRAVQVGVPCPLLERVVIIDTPGVGGLASGFAELALQSLQFADALLFVTEIGGRWTADEVEFLRRATARTTSIILAFTKIDTHPDWRAAQDEKVATIADEVPALTHCPVVAVNNRLALSALGLDNLPRSAAQRNEAGFNALDDAVREHVIDCATGRFAAAQIRDLIWPLAAMHRTLTAPAESPATVDDEWSRAIDAEVAELASERADACARGVADIRRRYQERVADSADADHEPLPAELLADLTALAAQLNETAAVRLVGIADRVLDEIDSVASIRDSIAAAVPEVSEPWASQDLVNPATARYDNLAVLSSFCASRPVGMTLMGSGLGLTSGPIVAPPVDIAVGLGLGGVFGFQPFEASGSQDFGSEFRDWMHEQCDRAEVTAGASFDRGVADVTDEIRHAVRSVLAEREAQAGVAQRAADDPGLPERRQQAADLLRRAVTMLEAVGAGGAR